MEKSPDAFRTISEVADHLETPAHVLRFWESRFPQIRPVKRAGGRRYYRPTDVALLTGIKQLLHDEGMTIRGVQKILREQGVRHVAGLSGADLMDENEAADDMAIEAALASFARQPAEEPETVETARIFKLGGAARRAPAAGSDAASTDAAIARLMQASPPNAAPPLPQDLVSRLHRLPPGALLASAPAIRPLRDRLLGLQRRMVTAPVLTVS